MYTYTDKDRGEIKVQKIAIEINNTVYTITYFAQGARYNNYLPTVERMIDSLKIISMLPHEDFDIGMKIEYPSNWNKIEEPIIPPTIYEYVPSITFSPKQSSNVIRIFSYIPYSDNSLSREANRTIDRYGSSYPDFKLVGTKQLINLTSSFIPSYMFNYSYTDSYSDKKMKTTEILTNLTNNRIFSISYSAEEEEFSRVLPTLSMMLGSVELFNVLRYELPGTNSSGIILRYPDVYPWEINEIDDKNTNLMRKNRFDPSIKHDFFLSVFPFNKSLSALGNELREFYDKRDFRILNENKTDIFKTTLDDNVTAYRMIFSYHDKNIDDNVNGVQVFTVFDNNAFIVTYLAEASQYDTFLSTVEETIDSIKIITPIKGAKQNLVPNSFKSGPVSEISQPKSWNFTALGVGFEILSPMENNSTDKFNESLSMIVTAAGLQSLGRFSWC